MLADQLRGIAASRGLPPGIVAVAVLIAVVLAATTGWWCVRGQSGSTPVELSLPMASVAAAGSDGAASGDLAAAAPASGGVGAGPSSSDASSEPTELVVHAAGAVLQPGLYRLEPGSRIIDLVDAAGGLAPDADRNRINLAAPLVDGARVYILRQGEATEPAGGMSPSAATAGAGVSPVAAKGPVNINTASTEELDTLPGVGPATAQAIVDHRQKHGRFRNVDDLLDVRGIGDAKLEALRAEITV